MAPPLEILGLSHASKIQLFHFSPNLLFQTIVSFFTKSFVSDRCFIFHPIIRDRCFNFHPIVCFQTVVSFFTQSYIPRPLFHFLPKIRQPRDSNLRPSDLIHDESEHRTTVSCFWNWKLITLWNVACSPKKRQSPETVLIPFMLEQIFYSGLAQAHDPE